MILSAGARDDEKMYHRLCYYKNVERKGSEMDRTYKKSASYPHPTNYPHHNRHTNSRTLRKRMDRRDRRQLNRIAEEI